MSYAKRFESVLNFHGETLTLTAGQQSRSLKAVVRPLDTSTLRTYFEDAEAAVMKRPGLVAIVSGSEAVSAGNTVTRDGRTYPVRQIAPYRIGDQKVGQALLLEGME